MPKKLKVLVCLLAVGVVLTLVKTVVALATDSGSVTWNVLSGAFGVLLLVGVLRGKEFARVLLIVLATIALVLGFAGVMLTLGLSRGFLPQSTPVLLPSGALQIAYCYFVIWCLRQDDVQEWMFNRSLTAAR